MLKTDDEMKKYILYFLFLIVLPDCLLAQTFTVGSSGTEFTTLKEAFDYINAGNTTGDIVLQIIDNTVETETAILYESGHDGYSDYSSVTIYPTGSGYSITGNLAGPLIELNGASQVTIDGRVNTVGSTKDLTITNTSNSNAAGTSTIEFINGASNCNIKYCKIKGSSLATTGGIISFSTSTASTGNSSNTIDHNDITNSSDANRPVYIFYSYGSSGLENSENIISNNNIYNCLNKGLASVNIYLSSFTTGWTISGNSFYEENSFAPSASVSFAVIQIDNTSGSGFTISDNYIGGNAPSASGTWTKSNEFNNVFHAIDLNVGTSTFSSVQNNTIKNFSWSNSSNSSWYGIFISAGNVNIGTESGNTIGSVTGTGSIVFNGNTSLATGINLFGIYISSTGTVICDKNNIGSITITNSDATSSGNVTGIYKSATEGSTTISNNLIGSTETANSINAGTTSTTASQVVYGINTAGTGNITINSNTICNLINGTTNAGTIKTGLICGINSSNGTNIISENSIYNLTNANANNASNQNASVIGICMTGNTLPKTVSGNTIYNLSNSYSTFTGSVIGLYFAGSTGTNYVKENFIHSLSVSSSTANIYGIRIYTNTTATYSNNIISIGGNTNTAIYGIHDPGTACNIYFNTIYIYGSPTSGVLNSYAIFNNATTGTKVFKNNIFFNARSNNGATGKHYAIRLAGSTNMTIDYNDYFASGTGGVIGFLSSDRVTLAAWRTATGQDLNSLNTDPTFINPPSNDPANYKIGSATLTGVTGTGITTDFGLNSRGTSSVTMGAWEKAINKWIGTTSTAWNISSNWTGGVVPGDNANIIFDAAADKDCYLDADHSVTNIENGTIKNIVTNSHKLTIKGSITLSSSGKINASSSSSIVEFAGSAAQTIPAGTFVNDEVYDLVVNNTNNVSLYGTLKLLNTFSATNGRLNAYSDIPVVWYSGSASQNIETSTFLNNRIYDLVINNTSGVTLNSDFTVDNSMTINSGAVFTVSAPRLLTVSGTLSNSAGNTGLVIKSDASGDGKLINNSSGVNATVELFLQGDYTIYGAPRFHYFIPPVVSMDFDNTDAASVATDLGLTYFNGDLTNYSESDAGSNIDTGWQYFDGYDFGFGPTTSFSTLYSTMGYNVFLTSDDKITFTGTLNSASHSFNLSHVSLGWNLVGNPFPCNYDLNGISALTTSGDGINNTIYFNHNGGYAYWNLVTGGTTGYSDIIAPMQGFFVHAIESGKSMTLPSGSKTAATASPFRSKGTDLESKGSDLVKKIKLVLNNGAVPDETIVCLLDGATSSFDGDYDAYKFFGKGSLTPSIYSSTGSVNYAINTLPNISTEHIIVPLTIVLKEGGTYKIDITEFENLDNLNVVLKHGAIETELTKDASYSFASASGTFTDFQLIFNNITTGLKDNNVNKLVTWYSNKFLYINCPDEFTLDRCSLIIYDFNGKIVSNDNNVRIVSGGTIQLPVNLQQGIYIIRTTIGNNSIVSKIVIY